MLGPAWEEFFRLPLDTWNIFLLFSLGIFSGAMSAVVGGSAVIVFPALLAMGLTPIEASITILVSLMPSGFAAAYYDRSKLPAFDRSLFILVLTSVFFAIVGAVLLLATPLAIFQLLVPILLAFATFVFASSARIARAIERLGGRADAAHNGSTTAPDAPWRTSTWAMAPVGIYTGYFGAGVGVMLLGVLSIGSRGDYRIANALKNMLIGLNNIGATTVYAIGGAVMWPVAGVMICGTLLGAWIGVALAKVARRDILRVVVIVVGCVLTLLYTYRFWIKPLFATG